MRPTNIGAHVKVVSGGVATATAAGTGDNTELSGPYASRIGYYSASVWCQYHAVLAEGETLSVAANLQDATDSGGTGVADFGSAYASAVIATGGSGGSTETGAVKLLDIDLTEANGYLRGQHTPNLSASGTDTSRTALVIVLGGADTIPAV